MRPKSQRLITLDRLEATFHDCDRCGLSEQRKNVVHWRGNPYAKLCAIGEAPGADEDDKGLPFVGVAGRKLDELMAKAGLVPAQDVFIINMAGCRPPNNRKPTSEECKACRPRMELLLAIAKPRALLLLGAVAALRMAGITAITQWRGRETEVEFNGLGGVVTSLPAIPTFHPSYLLRQGNSNAIRLVMIDDIEKAWRLTK